MGSAAHSNWQCIKSCLKEAMKGEAYFVAVHIVVVLGWEVTSLRMLIIGKQEPLAL